MNPIERSVPRSEVVLDCNHLGHYYDYVELRRDLDVNRKLFVEDSEKNPMEKHR